MTLKDDLSKYAKETHRLVWTTRDGDKVPEPGDVGLGNEAVKLDGAVLYADLAESTALVTSYKDEFAAEVYKNYLYCAARVIRSLGGTVTAYDGDRVMGVFIGDAKNSTAAKCGLKINWAVINILRPALKAQYPNSPYVLAQKVGIDSSPLFVANTGIRGNNDLVWVGPSANNAAKMAALSTNYATYISAAVYELLSERSKYGSDPAEVMWEDLGTSALVACN